MVHSGYTFYGFALPIKTLGPACYKTKTSTWEIDTTPDLISSTVTYDNLWGTSETIMAHPAWQITWEASDTSTLSPAPPALTNGMYIDSWVPGSPIEEGRYDNTGTGGHSSYGSDPGFRGSEMMIAICVGVPMLALCMCGGCCYGCKRHDRKLKREAALADQVQLERIRGAIDRAVFDSDGAAGDIPRGLRGTSAEAEEELPAYTRASLQEAPPAYVEGRVDTRREDVSPV
jgi:hypothetical protein